ncbi:MAG: sugar nucleotide-binding protein [Thermodesulfobacteriota bacterium]|nr:sugar nucleotide-binding protein [Thermodesulfobacteriota bacterium]
MSIFEKDYDIVGVDIDELDITDYAGVETMIRGARPDVIINRAAYTNVDAAETERETAWQVNWAIMC